MKLYKLSTIFIISAFFLFGCQPQHDLNKIKTQVQELNDALVVAMLANDSEAAIKHYTQDAISLPSYQPMIKGLEAIKSASQNQPPMNMSEFVLTTTDVLVSGNFVVDIGTYSLKMDMPEAPGGEVTDNGKYLTLFEIQKDGSLLIKADTWNTDMNPWEAMQHSDMKSE
jgi:ketosteroid isomerase-like protein